MEKLFVARVPLAHCERGLVHPPIFVVRVDIVPPRLDPGREALGRPQPHLRLRPGRQPEAHARRVIQSHALGRPLVPAEEAMYELTGLAVRLETGRIAAALAVEHDHLCPPADLAVVAKRTGRTRNGAANHSDPEAL